jgi:hypothetical protein
MPTTKLANGMTITTYPVPPASFDLEKATDSERDKYGIPHLPPGSDPDKRWKEMVRRLRFVEPTFEPRERKGQHLPSPHYAQQAG